MDELRPCHPAPASHAFRCRAAWFIFWVTCFCMALASILCTYMQSVPESEAAVLDYVTDDDPISAD